MNKASFKFSSKSPTLSSAAEGTTSNPKSAKKIFGCNKFLSKTWDRKNSLLSFSTRSLMKSNYSLFSPSSSLVKFINSFLHNTPNILNILRTRWPKPTWHWKTIWRNSKSRFSTCCQIKRFTKCKSKNNFFFVLKKHFSSDNFPFCSK